MESTGNPCVYRLYGKYVPDIEEARRLTEASRTEIIYMRQNELKDSKTEGVQRLKKERRELEERAILTNEKAAAAALAGQAVNSAVRDHVKHITSEFENALKDLDESKGQIKNLMETREGLLARNSMLQHQVHIYVDHNAAPSIPGETVKAKDVDSGQALAGAPIYKIRSGKDIHSLMSSKGMVRAADQTIIRYVAKKYCLRESRNPLLMLGSSLQYYGVYIQRFTSITLTNIFEGTICICQDRLANQSH